MMQPRANGRKCFFFLSCSMRGTAAGTSFSRSGQRACLTTFLILAAAGPWNGCSQTVFAAKEQAASESEYRPTSTGKGNLRSPQQLQQEEESLEYAQLREDPGLAVRVVLPLASPTPGVPSLDLENQSVQQRDSSQSEQTSASPEVIEESSVSRRLLPPFKPWGLKSKKEPPVSPPTVQVAVPSAPLGGVYLGPRAGIINDLYRETTPRPATSYLIEESRLPPPTATELIDIGNQHRKYLLANTPELKPQMPREPLLDLEVSGPPSVVEEDDIIFFHEFALSQSTRHESPERQESVPLTPMLPGSPVPSLLESRGSPGATPGAITSSKTGQPGSGGGSTFVYAEKVPQSHGQDIPGTSGHTQHSRLPSSSLPPDTLARPAPVDHSGSFGWAAEQTGQHFSKSSPHTAASVEKDDSTAPARFPVGYYSSIRHPSDRAAPYDGYAAVSEHHVAQLVRGGVTGSHQHWSDSTGVHQGREKVAPAGVKTVQDDKRFQELVEEALYLVCLQQAQNGRLTNSQQQRLTACIGELESYDGAGKAAFVPFLRGQASPYLAKFCHLPYVASEETTQAEEKNHDVSSVSAPPPTTSSALAPAPRGKTREIDGQLLQNILESLLTELQQESEAMHSQLQDEENLDAAERDEVSKEIELLAEDINLVTDSLARLKAGTLSQEELEHLWTLLAQEEPAPAQHGGADTASDPAHLASPTKATTNGATGAGVRVSEPLSSGIVRNPYYSEPRTREKRGIVHSNSAHASAGSLTGHVALSHETSPVFVPAVDAHVSSGSLIMGHAGLAHQTPPGFLPAADAHVSSGSIIMGHTGNPGSFSPDHAVSGHHTPHPGFSSLKGSHHHQHHHSPLDSHVHAGARNALMTAILEGAIEIKIRILKSMHELNHLLESTNMPPERQEEARELLKYLSGDLEKLHQIVAHVEADELSMDDLQYISVELEAIRRQANAEETQESGRPAKTDLTGGSAGGISAADPGGSVAGSSQPAPMPADQIEAAGLGYAGAPRSSPGRDNAPSARTNVYITINIDDKGDVTADSAGGGGWRS